MKDCVDRVAGWGTAEICGSNTEAAAGKILSHRLALRPPALSSPTAARLGDLISPRDLDSPLGHRPWNSSTEPLPNAVSLRASTPWHASQASSQGNP